MKNINKALLLCLMLLVGGVGSLVALSGCSASDVEYDNDASIANNTNASSELSIAVLGQNSFLETAALRFEEMHDGRYTINIVVYDDFASYSQTINTAVMSGMGEDIIHAAHLTWERLAIANRLVNLDNYLNFGPGVFYQNVLDAFLLGGGRYVVPLSFHLEAFTFGDMVDVPHNLDIFTFDDFLALTNAHPSALPMMSPRGAWAASIAERFFNLQFDDFICLTSRRSNVYSSEFIHLLEGVQSMSEGDHPWYDGRQTIIIEDILFNPSMASSGMPDYSNFHILTNSRGEGMVSTFDIIAMNANSQNQELAGRLMQFLLSEEMQASPEIWQTAVNKNAAIANAHTLYNSIRVAEGSVIPDEFDLETNIAAFNRLAARASMVATSDPFIRDFVRTEMTRFFDNEVSAEQAAHNLHARLTTYLNE